MVSSLILLAALILPTAYAVKNIDADSRFTVPSIGDNVLRFSTPTRNGDPVLSLSSTPSTCTGVVHFTPRRGARAVPLSRNANGWVST